MSPVRLIYILCPRDIFVDDDDQWFLQNGWPTKVVEPHFQLGPLSEIFVIANFQHKARRMWTCAEPEFKLCWIKLYSNDNHHCTCEKVDILFEMAKLRAGKSFKYHVSWMNVTFFSLTLNQIEPWKDAFAIVQG